MPQVRDKFTEEEMRPVREKAEEAPEMERRRREWTFPLGSPATSSKPEILEE